MKKGLKFLLFMMVLMLVGGVVGYQALVLADYNITSDSKSISEVFSGKISIVGSNNRVTVKPGSEVEWITLLGNGNTIRIQKGAQVIRIRGGGGGNTIIAPDDLEIDLSLLRGSNNKRQPTIAPTLDGL